jgi:hypothetical protein
VEEQGAGDGQHLLLAAGQPPRRGLPGRAGPLRRRGRRGRGGGGGDPVGQRTYFSAGDVAGLLERPPDENLAMCRRAHRVLGRYADESPLFVAAIAGHALGAGYELALAATSASPPRVNTASGCPTSRSACCPPPAAPSGCPAWSASAASNSAAGLAAGAPLAVAAITRVVNDGVERSLADALAATWRSWPTCSPPTTPARA